MGSIGEWASLVQQCIDIQQASLPKQWLLSASSLPLRDRQDVTSVPEESGIMSALEIEMTQQDATSILSKYRAGEWTVRAVMTAFVKRATIGQQLLNFATEFLAEEALETADALDAHFKSTGELIGPLHGIPISVKEHIQLAGKISHAGFVSKISNIAKEDALVVKLLRQAGAVIHVRTNQPQSLMHLDCDNNITGKTLNPHNLALTPGGSSGGEGACVGFRASVMGVGTDIGGSVRVPAAFNNCYGLRPSTLRNSNLGLSGINPGQESIRGIVGPLTQSMRDAELFEKALLDQAPWEIDTTLLPMPWRSVEPAKALTVGIMRDDGIVRPHPPVLRALDHAAAKLKAAGIEVVDWTPYKHSHGWDIVSALYFPDSGARYRAEFTKTGEPELPLTTWAIEQARKQPLTVADNWDLNAAREAYRREYHALMKKRGVDVILCPSYPGTGALQGTAKYWNYTAVWNILDQPAVSFPSGLRCDRDLDKREEEHEPRNEHDKREWEAYAAELFHGFPISLQLVGKHWQDEALMAAAAIVDGILRD